MGINYKHVQQTNMGAELRDIWGFSKDDIPKTTEEALGKISQAIE
jgi:hypothetical protein